MSTKPLAKTRRLQNIGSVKIPKSAVRAAAKCSFCFNSWNNLPYKVRIEPKHKISSSSKKILRRNESQVGLRPVEKRLLKRLESNSNTNNLMLMCSFCKKTTKMPLPRKEAPVQEELPLITPKSKKRKKDKMCGLVIQNSPFGAASPVVKRDNSLKLAETPRSSTRKTALFQTPKRLQAASPATPKTTSTPVISNVLKGGKKPKLNKDTVKKMMKHEVKDNIRSFLMPMP